MCVCACRVIYGHIAPVCVQVGICEYKYVYICASLIDLKLPQWSRLAGLRASSSLRETQGAQGIPRALQGASGATESLREPQGAPGSLREPKEAPESLMEPQEPPGSLREPQAAS